MIWNGTAESLADIGDARRAGRRKKPPKAIYHGTCAECGQPFTTSYRTKCYCDPECNRLAQERKRRKRAENSSAKGG